MADRTRLGPVRRAAPRTPRHPSAGLPPTTHPDRIIFDKLIQVLVFGCVYERIADHTCCERTVRRRRDEGRTTGIMAWLERIARDAYDRMIGLSLADLAVDGCITKAPCGGEVAGTARSTGASAA